MRHLVSEDVESLLTMEACLDALRIAYDDMGRGDAAFSPRCDILMPTAAPPIEAVDGVPVVPPVVYGFKSMGGMVRSMDAAAIRLNSDVINWPTVDDRPRRVKIPAGPGGQYTAFVQVFSATDGRLLAVMPDGYLQRMRVGGTNGIAADLLADPDATTMAVLGAGWQAGSHVMAVDALRDLEEVRVYSPNTREAFAAEMSANEAVSAPVRAADSPEAACAGADIVMLCTNQLEPVFTADLLEPGMHLGCVRHCEIDARTYNAADLVAMHTTDQLEPQHYYIGEEPRRVPEVTSGWTHPEEAEIELDWSALPELATLLAEGFDRGPEEVTVFNNNIGIGIQFAAVGKRVYELAEAADVGTAMDPEDWAQPHHP